MTKVELIKQLWQIWSDLDDALRGLEFEISLDDVQYLDLVENSADQLKVIIDQLKKENQNDRQAKISTQTD